MHADPILKWTIPCLLAFGLSWGGVWALMRGFSQRLVDVPNQRSSHTRPTPRGGGIAFVAAFFIAMGIAPTFLYEAESGHHAAFNNIVVVLLPLWIVGTFDDARGVSARLRLLIQIASASLAVLAFGPFPGLRPLVEGLGGDVAAVLLSVTAVVALINFYNFMDGVDGLVGGTSAVQLAFFAWYLQQPEWWMLAAALLAFLHWNWPPAKIFMGDSGSTVLGAAAALALLRAPDAPSMWWAGVVTAPLLGDAVFTLLRRLSNRENIFEAHKSHIYQRLHQSGWSHQRVAGAYVSATLGLALLVLALG